RDVARAPPRDFLAVAQLLAVPLQRDAAVLRDDRGHGDHARSDAARVVTLTEARRHGLAEDARLESVREDAFESVAGLEARLALVERDQQQEPGVLAALPGLP